MAVPRSTGFSLVFKGKIYVFGGYSGKSKRSKKIECYTPEKDYWETLEVTIDLRRSSCSGESKRDCYSVSSPTKL